MGKIVTVTIHYDDQALWGVQRPEDLGYNRIASRTRFGELVRDEILAYFPDVTPQPVPGSRARGAPAVVVEPDSPVLAHSIVVAVGRVLRRQEWLVPDLGFERPLHHGQS